MHDSLDSAALDELRRAGGDDLLHRMIRSFLAAAPTRVEQARAGIDARDGEAIRFALHALATSAATVGATELAGSARRGQVLVWEQDEEELRRIVAGLPACLEEADAALRAILED